MNFKIHSDKLRGRIAEAKCQITRREFLDLLKERDAKPYSHKEYTHYTSHIGSTPRTRLAVATGYIYEIMGKAVLPSETSNKTGTLVVLADTLTESEWDELLGELLGDEYNRGHDD